MNQFKQARRKLMNSIIIPLAGMLILVSASLYATITIVGNNNYQASVENAIEQKINYFHLTISLQKSSNSTITSSSMIEDYANGQSDLESNLRSALSQKVAQSPNLIGSQLYFFSHPLDPVYSYSVSGIPDQEELFDLPSLVRFLEGDAPSIFTIRHQAIANNYNFVQYPPDYGLFTLFEKVVDQDNHLIAVLASDFSSNKLLTEIFDFSYQSDFDNAKIQLVNQNDFLKFSEEDIKIAGDFSFGLTNLNLTTNIYKYELNSELDLLISLNLSKLLFTNLTFFALLFLATIMEYVLMVLLVRYTVKRIINPLETINQNIRKTLE